MAGKRDKKAWTPDELKEMAGKFQKIVESLDAASERLLGMSSRRVSVGLVKSMNDGLNAVHKWIHQIELELDSLALSELLGRDSEDDNQTRLVAEQKKDFANSELSKRAKPKGAKQEDTIKKGKQGGG